MVTTEEWSGNRVPIYKSTDLKTWEFQTFVFSDANFPKWINCHGNNTIYSPELKYIGGAFNVYFHANDVTFHLSIGVATAPTPTGPYRDIGDVLRFEQDSDVAYATIAQDLRERK